MGSTAAERLKWFLTERWPAGYRLASRLHQTFWDRRHARELARSCTFYRPLVPAGGLCFDLGANHGARTEVFLRLGARVLAVEPQPHCARRLRARFGPHPGFALAAVAVGARPGEAVLHLGKDDLISTLSGDWLATARSIPELAAIGWEGTITVEVTTLDRLIAVHGRPDFCKIDVEGFELEVLRGLSQPLPCLSLEYTRWRLDPLLACLERLAALGVYRFNLSEMESMELRFGGEWLTADALRRVLEEERASRFGYGDVYARLETAAAEAPR
jgi:FkbM family methyltransferase